jgi:hypothetical protein
MFDLNMTDVIQVTYGVCVFDEIVEHQSIVLFRILQFIYIFIDISDSGNDFVSQELHFLSLLWVVLNDIFGDKGE